MQQQLFSFAGRSIWVIGGAGYFGSAITCALDQLGANVTCFDLGQRAQDLVATKGLIRTCGETFDMTDLNAIEPTLSRYAKEYGTPDGLVHLAFLSTRGRTVEDMPLEEFQNSVSGALTATFSISRVVGEMMKSRNSGSIVLFSSMYGMVSPDPEIYRLPLTPNPIDYGASKAGVLQMTRYLAVHYARHGIRVNSVVPGPFPHDSFKREHAETTEAIRNKVPLRRLGEASEIVGPTLFLLSSEASYVTGHNLVVDGGWTAW